MQILKIYIGDAEKLADLYLPPESVSLLFTDPPWSVKKFEEAWKELCRIANRVLVPGGHLVTFIGKAYLPQVLDILREETQFGKLSYEWELAQLLNAAHGRLQWYISEQTPILVFCKLPRKFSTCRHSGDLIRNDAPVKYLHEWGQGIEGAQTIISRFSKVGDTVVDPFLGGGSFALACEQEGGRRFIGFEDKPKTFERLNKLLPGACQNS